MNAFTDNSGKPKLVTAHNLVKTYKILKFQRHHYHRHFLKHLTNFKNDNFTAISRTCLTGFSLHNKILYWYVFV